MTSTFKPDRSQSFKVFICHNSKDKPMIRAIVHELDKEDISYWLDEKQLPAGTSWLTKQEHDMSQLDTVAVFIGKNGIGKWQRVEISIFLQQFVEHQIPIIPVFLPDAPPETELMLFLKMFTWVDFRHTDPDPMQALIQAIKHPQRNSDLPPRVQRFINRNPKLVDRCKPQVAVLTSLGVTLLIAAVRLTGLLQSSELVTYDYLLQARLASDPNPQLWQDDRIAIIEITDQDIDQQKKDGEDLRNTSISHASLLRLLKVLDQAKPLVIGLDLYRDDPLDSRSKELLQRFRTQKNLFTVCKVDDTALQEGEKLYNPPPDVPSDRIGFSDFTTDADGVLRRQLLAFREAPNIHSDSKCQADRAFHLQLADYYLKAKEKVAIKEPFTKESFCTGIVFSNGFVLPNLQFYTGGYQAEERIAGCQMLLDYRTNLSEPIAPHYSLTKVLGDDFPIDNLRDRIVLIVSISSISGDLWRTPFASNTPGAYLQAQMISQILNAESNNGQNLIWVLPWWAETLWIFGWASVGSGLGWGVRSRKHLLMAVGTAVSLLCISCLVFFWSSGWLPLLPSVLVLVITSGIIYVQTLWQNLVKQRLHLNRQFKEKGDS
jgi:CHASE2 domain-containing sensor protein